MPSLKVNLHEITNKSKSIKKKVKFWYNGKTGLFLTIINEKDEQWRHLSSTMRPQGEIAIYLTGFVIGSQILVQEGIEQSGGENEEQVNHVEEELYI